MKSRLIRDKQVLFILLCCICLFSYCDKFLEIDPPRTQLVPESVFNDNNVASTAVLAIYSRMLNDGKISYRIPLLTGVYSDELKSNATSVDVSSFYLNSLTSTNGANQLLWSNLYKYVYHANAVLEALEEAPISQVVLSQLKGEALFIRAFCFFYLVNLYGDVPLILSTNYAINNLASRTSVARVYEHIIDDLKRASSLLNEHFVDANSYSFTNERVRASKYSALALLARVYLYNRNYMEARSAATMVISRSDLFGIDSNLNDISIRNNKEAILQLQTFAGGSNTPEGSGFLINAAPLTGENRSSTISSQLMNSFEEFDKRKSFWIKSNTVAGKIYSYPSKYKLGAVVAVSEYSAVLRLSEQYLIRAECYVHEGDTVNAKADINVVRRRAGLAQVTVNSHDSLLKVIMHERQVELFCEWGHRWMDLKRSGSVDSVMGTVTPLKGSGAVWDTRRSVWPIPQIDRVNDPNLTQNPGYN